MSYKTRLIAFWTALSLAIAAGVFAVYVVLCFFTWALMSGSLSTWEWWRPGIAIFMGILGVASWCGYILREGPPDPDPPKRPVDLNKEEERIVTEAVREALRKGKS